MSKSELIDAAYAYVESVRDTADYYGMAEALRNAFAAGAEWQQKQSIETEQRIQIDIAFNNLIRVINDKLYMDAEAVAEAIKLYVVAETIETIRAMVKSHVLIGG